MNTKADVARIVMMLLLTGYGRGGEVAGFRGDGSGCYADRLPVTTWSETTNVIWKTRLPSWSNASPVPSGDRIYACSEPFTLACIRAKDGRVLWQATNERIEVLAPAEAAELRAQQEKAGTIRLRLKAARDELKGAKKMIREAKDAEARAALVARVDEAVGNVQKLKAALRELEVAGKYEPPGVVPRCGYSSPTPVTDGQHVWAVFGNGIGACYGRDGARKWIRFLELPDDQRGHASSPVLADGKLLVHINKTILGLDALTGETIWTCGTRPSWGTSVPVCIDGEWVIVCADGGLVTVKDGTVAARARCQRNIHNYGSPIMVRNTYVFVDSHRYAGTGSRAFVIPERITPDTKTPRAWAAATLFKYSRIYASPVHVDGLIFALNSAGDLGIINAAGGKKIAVKKTGLSRPCFSSLTAADNVLIVGNESGDMAVLTADSEARVIGRGKLPGPMRGTPALADNRLYVRAGHALYCIGGVEGQAQKAGLDQAADTGQQAAADEKAIPENKSGIDRVGNKEAVIDLGNGVSMAFVWIEPGTFVMGSPESEKGRNNDEIQHTVRLTKGFWMGKYEVTQEQWRQVMGNCPSYFDTYGDQLPVDQMSWFECNEFMRRLDDLCDVYIGTFRLPTEAEWEYACRAGTTTPFHYGEETKPSMVNCWEQAPRDERGRRQKSRSVDVGSFEPNAWGLYDMHGSLWEWCADGYGRYPTNDVVDPCRQGKERVVRGGSWRWPLLGCRSAVRAKRNPGYSHNHHGFRVVASREPTPATRDR